MKRSSRRRILGIVFSSVVLVLILSVLIPTLGSKNKAMSGVNNCGYGYGYDVSCRFTGGGTIKPDRELRVTYGFELHCNVEELTNNLEVNWGGDHFHLDVLTQLECSDDLAIHPNPPRASCDTIHGWGEGKYNGVSGYYVEFIFIDAGEPGKVDWAWIKITDSDTDTVMEVSGFLKFGNQQAYC